MGDFEKWIPGLSEKLSLFVCRIYLENLKILQWSIMSWLKISLLEPLKSSSKSKVMETMFMIKELYRRYLKVYHKNLNI
jgi:hypothetical protein